MAHPSARLTPKGRRLLVDRVRSGWTITKAADAAGISRQTGSKWVGRFRRGVIPDSETARAPPTGSPGHTPPRSWSNCAVGGANCASGPHVLAWETGLARSTVYALLRRRAWAGSTASSHGHLSSATSEPAGRARPPRYQAARADPARRRSPRPTRQARRKAVTGDRLEPGAHGDRRPHPAGLCRGAARRVTRPRPPPSSTRLALLREPRHHHRADPHRQRRLLPEPAFADACDELGIGHRFTRPYRPQTNGKAERMVRTLLAEWAYARPFTDTAERISPCRYSSTSTTGVDHTGALTGSRRSAARPSTTRRGRTASLPRAPRRRAARSSRRGTRRRGR